MNAITASKSDGPSKATDGKGTTKASKKRSNPAAATSDGHTAVSTGSEPKRQRGPGGGGKSGGVNTGKVQGDLKRKFGIGQGMSKELLLSALGDIQQERASKKKR